MEKNGILKAFNNYFFEFLSYIIDTIIENENIIYVKSSLEQVKRMNPTLLIKIWYSHVYVPYKEMIDQDNVEFIINKDYSRDVSNMNHADKIINNIDNIRIHIRKMTVDEKKKAMEYIKNLSTLSVLYEK
jgi:demethoxyubiquinone hydroxylase (CLK1/Coq7/Cat5 family)